MTFEDVRPDLDEAVLSQVVESPRQRSAPGPVPKSSALTTRKAPTAANVLTSEPRSR